MVYNEKLKPRTLHISLKEQGLAQLTDCASYLPIRFHLQNLILVNRN